MTDNLVASVVTNKNMSTSSNGPSTTLNSHKKSADDFHFLQTIGEGSFSTVFKVKEVKTGQFYAIKTCEKNVIRKEQMTPAIMREKEIMTILTNHPSPFFVKFYCSFQDSTRLFFVMNFCERGELLRYLNKVGSFDEDCTRFYSAEILLALEHLHRLKIIHRDLKPENILMNARMHIQITDFNSACLLKQPDENAAKTITNVNPVNDSNQLRPELNGRDIRRKNSFVGTAQYVSPEMLNNMKKVNTPSDLWALGCIIYQLTSGSLAFKGHSEYHIFKKICQLDYVFPDGFNTVIRDLIERLLVIEPDDRLGAKDELKDKINGTDLPYTSIRMHPFFKPLENRWDTLHLEEAPQILPYLPSNSKFEELRGQFKCNELDEIEPGLGQKQIIRLLGLELRDEKKSSDSEHLERNGIMDFSADEMRARLKKQEKESKFHRFVEGNLILKEGFLFKRKGLFARKRWFLLTSGPHIYYVDANNENKMELKGQIPFTIHLNAELKTFKNFFVHTPKRIYYLEDPAEQAKSWCEAIEQVRIFYKILLEQKERKEKREREKELNKLN